MILSGEDIGKDFAALMHVMDRTVWLSFLSGKFELEERPDSGLRQR